MNSHTYRLGATWAAVAALILGSSLSGWAADDQAGGRDDEDSNRGSYCTRTANAQLNACGFSVHDDYWVAAALCINKSDAPERQKCFVDAKTGWREGGQECRAQREARVAICGALGEARYDPSFSPADFDSDYRHLTNPNPYFPLTIGYRWDYDGKLETNTIVARDETKLIEGVTCIVLNDKRYKNGQLVEDTDDWYGQRKDGTVDFCGEQVNNFETFPGDKPSRPERLSTDGQWKTGRDGIPSGHYILRSPRVGGSHRQEFAPGVAEDTVHYLSTNYSYGSNPALDKNVPKALVDRFCGNGDCLVSGENSGLEPGAFTRKYYARGVGFFLGVDEETGDTVQLVNCNFDARCASLPQPQR
jgi:hypothetical protein